MCYWFENLLDIFVGAGTWTPLHADVLRSYSWSSNVCGRKLWHLLPADQMPMIYDRSSIYKQQAVLCTLSVIWSVGDCRRLIIVVVLWPIRFISIHPRIALAFAGQNFVPFWPGFLLLWLCRHQKQTVYDIYADISELQFPEFSKVRILPSFTRL